MKLASKLLTLLLALALIFTLIPVKAEAATSGMCGSNVNFSFNSTTGLLKIYGTGDMWEFRYNYGYSDAPWWEYVANIKKVEIGSGVTRIGNTAFNGCWNMESITIPSTVESIGSRAFYGCTALTSIEIPSKVTAIADYTFYRTGITQIDLPDGVTSLGIGAFGDSALTSIDIPAGVTTISESLFWDCGNLETVVIRGDITDIGDKAFYSTALKEITFEGTLSGTIGEEAFAYCDYLPAFHVPGTVTKIYDRAFCGCEGLTELTLEEGLESIYSGAFRETAISTVTIPSTVSYISGRLFDFVDTLESITVYTQTVEKCKYTIANSSEMDYARIIGDAPATTTKVFGSGASSEPGFVVYYDEGTSGWEEPTWNDYLIEVWGKPWSTKTGTCGENVTWTLTNDGVLTISGTGPMKDYSIRDTPWYMFRDRIQKVVVEDGVTTVGSYSFMDLKKLTTAEIAGSVETIGNDAFYFCYLLDTVVLNEGLKEIEGSAFNYCNQLTSIDLPDSVTTLGSSAFCDCGLLETVYMPAGLTELTNAPFSNCRIKEIYFPADAPTFGSSCFRNITATAYYPAGNETWTEDVMQDYGGTITWVEQQPENVASGTWGDNISWVLGFDGTLIVSGQGEVAENKNEPYPWKEYAEQIKKVIFEEGVTNVPVSAFEYSYPNLASAELKSVEVIESTAFAQCYALTSVILPDTLTEIDNGAFSDTGFTTIEIHEGVTRIGLSAFSSSKLTEIVLPEGLVELGDSAFYWCEDLKSVYMPDSVTDVGMGVFGNCTALETANISKGLTFVNDGMFTDCALKEIEIPEGITWLGMNCFSGNDFTTVTIPTSVTMISSSFMDCAELKEITFLGDAPEMGDYSFLNVTATAYYPADNATWTEDKLQNYGGTLTWEPHSYVKFQTASASLGGNIAMNFYVELSKDLLEDPDAFIRFTYAGKTIDVPLSEGLESQKDGKTRYRYSCRITSKNMTDEITAQVMNASGPVGPSATKSVASYAQWIIDNSSDEKSVNLMKGMLNYGAAAQVLFDYRTDALANAGLSEADRDLGDVDASAYAHSMSGTEEGIKPRSATLILDSETTIRVYFELTGEKSIEEFTFTVDGVEVEPKYKDGRYYIEVQNIAAHRLDDEHVFTCGDITIRYRGLSYVNQILNYYTDEARCNMARALYRYSQATEAYIA